MASTQVERRGCSSKGLSAIFHLQARAVCGSMPRANDTAIQPHRTSCMAQWMNSFQSVPLYIHQRMPSPNTKGRRICNATFRECFIFLLPLQSAWTVRTGPCVAVVCTLWHTRGGASSEAAGWHLLAVLLWVPPWQEWAPCHTINGRICSLIRH